MWRAADDLLHRRVAVKEMRIDGAFDGPDTEDGRLWIVMELVEARSLARYLDDEGPLDEHGAARVGLALVAALRRVHAAGVLHRDIKPENVLLGPSGPADRVVLTDFGIAALQDTGRLTQAGQLVGSPEYMAPERVSGAVQGPPSDLWSLGATLCTALRGSSPFARDSALNTLVAVLHEAPELPPESSGLRPVLATPRRPRKPPGDQAGVTDWRSRVLTALVLLVAAAVAAVMFFTARDPGGGEPPGPGTRPPTVAGTSTTPPSDGSGQAPARRRRGRRPGRRQGRCRCLCRCRRSRRGAAPSPV